MKRWFNFKYPKLVGLIAAILLAYLLFRNPLVSGFISHLGSLSYFGVFIAGILFAFGFTAPFAAGFFITLNPSNILLAGVLGGFGAFISDMLILKFIRFSFGGEFRRLERTKMVKKVKYLIDTYLGHKIKLYLLYAFAGVAIASPLPDEAGVILLAGFTKIKIKILAMLSFILNTLGILILLSI